MREKVFCYECGKECVSEFAVGVGYGIDHNGHKICYECCGKHDRKRLLELKPKEKYCLYLNGTHVINWPGTLKIKVNPKVGGHNIARVRRDVWFDLEGKKFHGVQYGDSSEILYIEVIKNIS